MSDLLETSKTVFSHIAAHLITDSGLEFSSVFSLVDKP